VGNSVDKAADRQLPGLARIYFSISDRTICLVVLNPFYERRDNGVEGSGHVHSVDRDQRSLESPRPRSYPSFLHSSFEPPIQSINLSTCLSAFVATWAELFTSSSTRNEIPFTG
jgi:hypothetical protein